jgi:hypothetical protein
MCTEANTICICDAHSLRYDVIDHPWELIDAVDGHVSMCGAELGASELKVNERAWAGRGPGDIGEEAEDSIEVLAMRLNEAMGEQVEAEVGISG